VDISEYSRGYTWNSRVFDIYMKRKYSSAMFNTPRSVRPKVTPLAVSNAINRIRSNQSSTTQQAMRIGGWSNPSKGGELKFVDTSINLDPTFNTTSFTAGTLLNGLSPGSDASSRIGRKVTIKSLLVRWSWTLGAMSVGGSSVRILIVYDKQSNATAPGITDILLTDDFLSQNNLSNRDRFVTLCDMITDPIATGANYSVSGVIYKKLNLETMFNAGVAGTIGDITSGSIYCFQAANSSITTASGDFRAKARIRYTDV